MLSTYLSVYLRSQHTFSAKDKNVNILGFVSHMACVLSIPILPLHHKSTSLDKQMGVAVFQ